MNEQTERRMTARSLPRWLDRLDEPAITGIYVALRDVLSAFAGPLPWKTRGRWWPSFRARPTTRPERD